MLFSVPKEAFPPPMVTVMIKGPMTTYQVRDTPQKKIEMTIDMGGLYIGVQCIPQLPNFSYVEGINDIYITFTMPNQDMNVVIKEEGIET